MTTPVLRRLRGPLLFALGITCGIGASEIVRRSAHQEPAAAPPPAPAPTA